MVGSQRQIVRLGKAHVMISDDVRPLDAASDAGHSRAGHTEMIRDSLMREPRGDQRSNMTNIVRRQSRLPVLRAARNQGPILKVRVAALLSHVVEIVLLRAKKQMRRVHARWSIAFVQHEESVRNLTVGDHPRDAVRQVQSTVLTATDPELAVTVRVLRWYPQPTLVWRATLDLRPESRLNSISDLVFYSSYSGLSHRVRRLQRLAGGEARRECAALCRAAFIVPRVRAA